MKVPTPTASDRAAGRGGAARQAPDAGRFEAALAAAEPRSRPAAGARTGSTDVAKPEGVVAEAALAETVEAPGEVLEDDALDTDTLEADTLEVDTLEADTLEVDALEAELLEAEAGGGAEASSGAEASVDATDDALSAEVVSDEHRARSDASEDPASPRGGGASDASGADDAAESRVGQAVRARSAKTRGPAKGSEADASPTELTEAVDTSVDAAGDLPDAPLEPFSLSKPTSTPSSPSRSGGAAETPGGAPLPEAEEAVDPAMAMRLMREASGVERAEVALEHPLFGALRMELALDDGAIDLRMLVPQLAGVTRLERDQEQLRALLRERGLQVGSLDIEQAPDASADTAPHAPPESAGPFVHHRYHWKA